MDWTVEEKLHDLEWCKDRLDSLTDRIVTADYLDEAERNQMELLLGDVWRMIYKRVSEYRREIKYS